MSLKVYVVIATMGGLLCLDDVGVFISKAEAQKDEERLCKELDVPFDEKEREKYYDCGPNENSVDLLEIEVGISPIIEAFVFAIKSTCSRSEDLTTSRVIAQEFVAAMNRRKLLTNDEAERIQKALMTRLG